METKKDGLQVIQQQLTPSQRFLNAVQKELKAKMDSGAELTPFQKRLMQNYFVSIDIAIRAAEEGRLKKAENKRDKLPITWENVDMESLAFKVAIVSKIGLDPAVKNHIFPIPYKDPKLNKYKIELMDGYKGKELVVMKYGLDIPSSITIEVLYENDIDGFKVIKKDQNNPVETYIFDVKNPLDRGEVVGGFYYISYKDNPEKNRIRVFNMAAIRKRVPKYASPEFWGGEKDKWVNGSVVGKEHVDGWLDEMVYKTVARAAYDSITIDSSKIDEAYVELLLSQSTIEKESDASDQPNKETIDTTAVDVTNQHALTPATTISATQPQPQGQMEFPEKI